MPVKVVGCRAPAATSISLSDRQFTVLLMVAAGWHDGDMASRLGISTRTVRQYIYGLVNRLECDNRCHLVAKAFVFGFLTVVRTGPDAISNSEIYRVSKRQSGIGDLEVALLRYALGPAGVDNEG